MPSSGSEPLEIHLESSDLVLRGLSGEELEPAVLNGELIVTLAEATNLKEIQLTFNGVAKVTWRDSSTHHHDHPLFFHDFHFLNPGASSGPSSGKQAYPTHTLKAGRHVFPFSLHIPGSLPASIRTYSGTCSVEYKLKAIATRPGFAADWKSRKIVRVARGFGLDAVEYNQTLEIENTWPGKVMYAFTIPHKAYAAGDTIPVSVKFSPLAKGVRIVSLVTTIREHTTVHSKNSSHSEARDATVVKYNFVPEADASGTNSPHPARIESSASLSSMNVAGGNSGASTPGFPTNGSGWPSSGASTPDHTPFASGSNWPGFPQRVQRQPAQDLAGEGEPFVPEHDAQEEIDDGIDTEVDVVVEVPVPIWTAPTHSVFPVFVNHKIKWSAFIKNPDGHVSELRCALPIHILASSLAEEARLASSGSRNLLFGESGVLAHSDVPQVDLPSYQDHIMDRVANADTASYFSLANGFAPTPWSCRTPGGSLTNPLATPISSPPGSRPSSRPASPTRNQSSSRLHSGRSSGTATPVTGPVSPAGELDEHPEDHRNWIDSELMNTLAVDAVSPPGSNPASRPGSRPPSRPASPDREMSHHSSSSVSPYDTSPHSPHNEEVPPPLSRNSSFFHLHIPKPLRPLTSFSRNASSSSLSSMGAGGHPSASALSSALAAHAAKTSGAGGRSYETHTHSAMSNSPTHGLSAAASPLSTSPELTSFFPPSSSYHNSHISTNSHFSSSSSASSAIPQTPGVSGTQTPGLGVSPSHGHQSPSGLSHSYPDDGTPIDFLSQVPSYDVAARGFLGGGVVPLSINASLPNYEDLSQDRSSHDAATGM